MSEGEEQPVESDGGNLRDLYRATIHSFGDTRSFVFVQEDREGMAEQRRTFRELDARARSIAAGLATRMSRGDRLLLLYPQGLEFVEAFLGCLYAGIVAVPAPVVQYRRGADRVAGIVRDAEAGLVLTPAEAVEEITTQLSGLVPGSSLEVAALPEVVADEEAWREPDLDPDDVVYLQYTSGSTSEPKGVMVTHANLLHNVWVLQRLWRTDGDSVIAGWIPHFHDMGLISLLLQPLHVGADCVFTSPLSFVKRPVLWLEMLSRFRGTTTIAPDFAFDKCTRTITEEDLAGLDLSSVRVMANGSEPVRHATLTAFARRFAQVGFRPEMFMPAYGLAEATLVVHTGHYGRPPTVREVDPTLLEERKIRTVDSGKGIPLVGHGHTVGFDVRIVAPETCEVLPEGKIGEIWVAGPSVAAGYWKRPRVTEATFRATTSDGDGPFLRTGDLGFLLEGELFVTGRIKDLIIMQGRNIYPQDLEFLVRETHPALAGRAGAAFSVDAGREHLVLLQEVRKHTLADVDPAELSARIRDALVSEFDVPYPSIVLMDRPVPRTTSGKVQRSATKAQWLNRELAVFHEDLEPALAAYLAGRQESSCPPS